MTKAFTFKHRQNCGRFRHDRKSAGKKDQTERGLLGLCPDAADGGDGKPRPRIGRFLFLNSRSWLREGCVSGRLVKKRFSSFEKLWFFLCLRKLDEGKRERRTSFFFFFIFLFTLSMRGRLLLLPPYLLLFIISFHSLNIGAYSLPLFRSLAMSVSSPRLSALLHLFAYLFSFFFLSLSVRVYVHRYVGCFPRRRVMDPSLSSVGASGRICHALLFELRRCLSRRKKDLR